MQAPCEHAGRIFAHSETKTVLTGGLQAASKMELKVAELVAKAKRVRMRVRRVCAGIGGGGQAWDPAASMDPSSEKATTITQLRERVWGRVDPDQQRVMCSCRDSGGVGGWGDSGGV